MKVFVYIDESGSIHINSKTRYFAVGGYFVLEKDKNKVTSLYKQINLQVKRNRNIDLRKELKSFDFLDEEKIEIVSKIQEIDSFIGCVKVFDKEKLPRPIYDCNTFYNYAVYRLFEECVLPFLRENHKDVELHVIINADDRNTGTRNIDDLEKFLSTTYCLYEYRFEVSYFNSLSNYGVQLADILVNTIYNSFKDFDIVKYVIPHIDKQKIIIE